MRQFGEREAVIAEYCACTARNSPLFCERKESNGWPVNNSETLSSLAPIAKNFRQRSSHFSRSASFTGRVFRRSSSFHFMYRRAISHSTAIAPSTIVRVQSPFFNSVQERLMISCPAKFPSGSTNQRTAWQFGQRSSCATRVPTASTMTVWPQPQITLAEVFILQNCLRVRRTCTHFNSVELRRVCETDRKVSAMAISRQPIC